MGLFQVVCMVLLADIARTQSCSNFTNPFPVSRTEDAGTLAASILACEDGDFAVEWAGEVFVAETIYVADGNSLNITGAGPGAVADGGGSTQLFVVEGGSRLHLSDMTLSNGNASDSDGGAISVVDSDVAFSGSTLFLSNFADSGGAIHADNSTVSWDGDGTQTQFLFNSARRGGAIFAYVSSTLSWSAHDTRFISNSADDNGGAIYADRSTLYWDGDGTLFSNNTALDRGGAIYTDTSYVTWDGDGTEFISNSAGSDGGAVFVSGGLLYEEEASRLSWEANGTQFISNSAGDDGGAVYLTTSFMGWEGDTLFSSNVAGQDGGAIQVSYQSPVILDLLEGETTFRGNVAGGNGGALAFSSMDDEIPRISGGTFSNNNATNGGALYVAYFDEGFVVTGMVLRSNSAVTGGAIMAVEAGSESRRATFEHCTFSDNVASEAGGAVETLSGDTEFLSCDFEGNSADIGGAMRLAGSADISECSFLSNSVNTRGLAIATIRFVKISGSSFDGNELYCAAGSYQKETQEGKDARFEAVCFDCPLWGECSGCTMPSGVVPVCEAPLQHTTAPEPGLILETLEIDGKYWRATNTSEKILACYNPKACRGGATGVEGFCASGYTGPYCAVCETGYSPSLGHTCTRCSSSRRQGLVAAAVIAMIVAVFAVVTIFKFLLSTKVEEENTGCFRRRILRAVPVQALKIIVVVWQILTQFADAANVTYPGVYQDFLSAIELINFDLGSVVAAGCLWSDIDFHDRLLVSTLGPLVVVGFLVMTYLIALRRSSASGDSAAVEPIRNKIQTALLLLTFLVYSSVSSIVFQAFACETLDDDVEYLRADYRIHCKDVKHKGFKVYAGIMVFVYPVGIPLLYAALLFQRRDVLADAGADKTVAQPIAGLWEAYRPERFYYEVFECGRRILLTGVVVFIFPNTAAQIAITMLISFFLFAVFEIMSPYSSESDMWLSRGGHVIVFLSMFHLLLLKVDVSGERDQSQAAFAGVLVAGHVLMIVAIVVEVAGLCYASRKEKVVEGEEASERSRVGSDDVPAFESAPASSFFRRSSVSEKPGPTRRVSGTVVTMGGP